MDSTQLNMISEASVGFLSAEQQAAVENVKNDDPVDPDPWPQESCEGTWRCQHNNYLPRTPVQTSTDVWDVWSIIKYTSRSSALSDIQ